MKTFNGLFGQLIDFDQLYFSYIKARRGKRDRYQCAIFENRLEYELIDIQNELIWGEYKTAGYRSFYVTEPKLRKITALKLFRDRVVQNSLHTILEPIWERSFIYDSYACRVGKGTHRGIDRVQGFLIKTLKRHGKIYALKADISKYFSSIDHDILLNLIKKKVVDERLLAVVEEIIRSYQEQPGKAIPIGNLTSQLFANIYLDHFDQWMKRTKKAKYYARYMDDFVVIHHDKQYLQALRMDAEAFLYDELRLSTNSKTQVFPVHHRGGRGLDFLGAHLWPNSRRLRKNTINRFSNRLKSMKKKYERNELDEEYIINSVRSTLAHAKHANGTNAIRKIIKQNKLKREAA